MSRRLRPTCWFPSLDSPTLPGRSKPSTAATVTDNKAFDLRMLQSMAKRVGATETEVTASHAVFMTQPNVVSDVIDEAARGSAKIKP